MKNTIKQLIIVVCSVLFICYAIMQLMLNVGDDVTIEYAAFTEVNDTVEVDAYIFRDETVISQNFRGTDCYMAKNGEKVHIGQPLCVTYSDSTAAGVQEEINLLNERIAVLEQSSTSLSAFSLDINKIDENISTGIVSIQRSVMAGELEKAGRAGNGLLIQMNRRQAAVSSVDVFGSLAGEYKSRKAILEGSLSGTRITTTAPAAGYFYSEADGYESAFSARAVKNITISEFERLTTQVSPLSTDNTVGKLADSSKWYLLFKYSKREAARFKTGSSVEIIFPYSSNRIVKMKLEKVISQTDKDEVLMVLSTYALPEGFNFTRMQQVELVKESFEGLRVRAEAMRKLDGVTGVYSLDGNVVKFKTVEIIYEDRGYYVVALPNKDNKAYVSPTALSLYDAVITEGKELYDGKVLK